MAYSDPDVPRNQPVGGSGPSSTYHPGGLPPSTGSTGPYTGSTAPYGGTTTPSYAPSTPPARDPPARARNPMPSLFAERPTAVTVLAVLLGLAALGALLVAFGHFVAADNFDGGRADAVDNRWQAIGLLSLLSAIAAGAAAWGTLTRMDWAWYVAVGAAVVGILLNLYGLYLGQITTFLFGLALSVAILAVAFSRDVISWFGVKFGGDDVHGRPA